MSKSKLSSSPDPAQDIVLMDELPKSRFRVFLAYLLSKQDYYALKAFPYVDGKPSGAFLRAARFEKLKHPNVASIVESSSTNDSLSRGALTDVSYTLMPYAPFGDFLQLLSLSSFQSNEKLVRTYFHQLIDGLEYLHSKGIAHLDLKLENLLLGDQLNLMIADLDDAYVEGDTELYARGTRNYRAPEFVNRTNFQDPKACDIYAAGIILFLLRTKGHLPFREEEALENKGKFKAMHDKSEKFWETHTTFMRKKDNFFSPEFKELVKAMTSLNPEERPSVQEIKQSKWLNMPIYSKDELVAVMKLYLNVE